jgi:hypothetical protein
MAIVFRTIVTSFVAGSICRRINYDAPRASVVAVSRFRDFAEDDACLRLFEDARYPYRPGCQPFAVSVVRMVSG